MRISLTFSSKIKNLRKQNLGKFKTKFDDVHRIEKKVTSCWHKQFLHIVNFLWFRLAYKPIASKWKVNLFYLSDGK